jgi:hypothetical protein
VKRTADFLGGLVVMGIMQGCGCGSGCGSGSGSEALDPTTLGSTAEAASQSECSADEDRPLAIFPRRSP